MLSLSKPALLLALLSFGPWSCDKGQPSELPRSAEPLSASADEGLADGSADASELGLPWEERSFSPRPGSVSDPRLEALERACGVGDAGLHEVASLLAEEQARSSAEPDLDAANYHLRRTGTPYVMPRLWSARMGVFDEAHLVEAVRVWAGSRPALGEYRCGLGIAEGPDSVLAVTVLQTDVLVDLKPIPTQTRAATWHELEGRFLVPASGASVLLLPPEGPPRTINTELSGDDFRARFPVETPGTFLVQLMATVSGGPRPVAQVLITAEDPPPTGPDSREVPGETSFDDSLPADDALFAILNAARLDQGLFEVKRNRRLDRLALEHCRAMLARGRISHDTGAGDPAVRLARAGMAPKATGENVALAGTVVRLHRALWSSPSHRENMLLRRWDEAGVAVLRREEDGALFATQLFIDSD